MLGFLEIFVIFVVLAITVVVISRVAAGKRGLQSDVPVCGNCGYPTEGLSELRCPECGADLTEVGIVMPGDNRSIFAGCLMPLLVTALIFLLAVGGSILAVQVVPVYEDQSTHFDINPSSDAYSEIMVSTEMILVIPAAERHQSYSFDIATNYGPPDSTTVDFGGGPKTVARVEAVALELMAMPIPNAPNTITYAPKFRVDTATGIATWSDTQGNTLTSKGPVVDKDLLAYFATYNVDTSRQDVVAEAQQLVGMIDELRAGKKQFTLEGFQGGGYGSGSTGSIGPVWASFAYVIVWFVIWIIAMIVVPRWVNKRSAAAAS